MADDVARYGWFVAGVIFAFIVVALVMGAIASALYIVDAHRVPSGRSVLFATNGSGSNCHGSFYRSAHLRESVQFFLDVSCL